MRAAGQLLRPPPSSRPRSPGCPARPAHSTSCDLAGRTGARPRAGAPTPFCRVIRPTNSDDGPVRVDAESAEHGVAWPGRARYRRRCRSRCAPRAPGRVQRAGSSRRTSARMPSLTAITASARLVRGPLDPRRDPVAAAELLGLPRPQRLQRVRGHARAGRRSSSAARCPAMFGVPGVGVHDVGAATRVGHHQVRRQRRSAGLAPVRRRVGLRRTRRRPRRADAVHVDVARACAAARRVRSTCTPAPP